MNIWGLTLSEDNSILKSVSMAINSVEIPKSVISIGRFAFFGCNYIKYLNIPKTVKYIGDNAFTDCGLEDIVIPSSVIMIGNGALNNCKKLKSVALSKNTKFLDKNPFYGCDKLEKFKYGAVTYNVRMINNNLVLMHSRPIINTKEEKIFAGIVLKFIDNQFTLNEKLFLTEKNNVISVYEHKFGKKYFEYFNNLKNKNFTR